MEMIKRLLQLLLILPATLLFFSCAEEDLSIRGSGTIEAVDVRTATKTAGEVVKLYVEEGSQVQKGEILAQIDHSTLDLQLEQAKAGEELADAQLALLLQGARKEDILQAEEAARQAEDALRLARENFERMEKLLSSGSVTLKQRDDAEARLTRAQAQNNSSEAGLRKLENLARPEELRAARARLKQAKITVALLEKKIRDSTVTARATGFITQKLVEQGELVREGALLFVISELSTVELTIYVKEPDLGRIALGQKASVYTDSNPGRPIPGRVVYISTLAEFTPKNVQTEEERVKLVFGVKISVENPNLYLKPGMPADAVLTDPVTKEADR